MPKGDAENPSRGNGFHFRLAGTGTPPVIILDECAVLQLFSADQEAALIASEDGKLETSPKNAANINLSGQIDLIIKAAQPIMRIEDNQGMWICRAAFIVCVAAIMISWPRLTADDRVWAAILAIIGFLLLVFSKTVYVLSTKLAYFGGAGVFSGLLTLVTGYQPAGRQLRIVDPLSGIVPLVIGLVIFCAAFIARRITRPS